ncbi:hypothetical protein CCR75_000866 [Bremia lactucae]|uniref:Exonuclease domain-containing protein n=1 Tax=Bremia lactucae TaxID=4779 RepID=A0A976FNF3_BRELC|nr:hypothetical protein CCR75_000866 [Bremia lactucae]
MGSEDECEDGEILQEGEAIAQVATLNQFAVSVALSTLNVPRTHQGIGHPSKSVGSLTPTRQTPRKRTHMALDHAATLKTASSIYDTRVPLSQRQRTTNHHNTDRRRDDAGYEPLDDRMYAENMIIKHPRQQPSSNVLLDFAMWMSAVRSRTRLNLDDVQTLVLNVLRGDKLNEDGLVSPFLLPYLFPGAPLPTKVCIIMLKNMHPSVVQKFRPTLRFFDQCSSMPVVVAKAELTQIRRSEAPIAELMYRFTKPRVDLTILSTEELFFAHELTFVMKHSAGFTDEVVLTPAGTFTRQSQPLGGTWKLDGDLLHLEWRQRTTKVALKETVNDLDSVPEEVENDVYTLDVLVSQDGRMHDFRTESVTDETYARTVPEHLMKKRRQNDKPRSLWLTLVKAIAVDVPRSLDGTLIVQKQEAKEESVKLSKAKVVESNGTDAIETFKREAFEYYLLSLDELKQHGFPLDTQEEQRKLLIATEGNTRDHYVATKPRPMPRNKAWTDKDEMTVELCTKSFETSSQDLIYALDCEMCETDIGMELTRVTLVDIKGNVVYDQLVKPQSTIINYHTEFSGISKKSLQHTKCILADVQRELTTRFLFQDTILVGHSLTSDLRALRLVHGTIVDTAILYPHERGFPFRTSLKYLTKTYVKKDIQMASQTGHDSAEDAIASLDLLLLKVREGPWYGIPESDTCSRAFDSIVDKVAALGKTMTMLRLQTEEDCERMTAKSAKRKPWDIFASGDHKDDLQSPFRHAQALKASAEADSPLVSSSSSAASALLDVKSCVSFDTLKSSLLATLGDESNDKTRSSDLYWIEIEPPRASTALRNDFVKNHEVWMAEQQSYCEQVDMFLQQVCEDVLPKGILVLALPQGDLSLLRYLKALRMRTKWRDANMSTDNMAIEELHAAVNDAFQGAMDSCLFLRQKR